MNVYWTTQTTVFSVPIGGGFPTALASAQNVPTSPATDGKNVFWMDTGTGAVTKL